MKNKNNLSHLVPQLKAKSALLVLSLLAVVSCTRTTDSKKNEELADHYSNNRRDPGAGGAAAIQVNATKKIQSQGGTAPKGTPTSPSQGAGEGAAVPNIPVIAAQRQAAQATYKKDRAAVEKMDLIDAANRAISDGDLKASLSLGYNLASIRYIGRPGAYKKHNEKKLLELAKQKAQVAKTERKKAEEALEKAESAKISSERELYEKKVKKAYKQARKAVSRLKACAQRTKGTASEQAIRTMLGKAWKDLEEIKIDLNRAENMTRERLLEKMAQEKAEKAEMQRVYEERVAKIAPETLENAKKALVDNSLKSLWGNQTGNQAISPESAGAVAKEHEDNVQDQLKLSRQPNKSLNELKAIEETAQKEVKLALNAAKVAYQAHKKEKGIKKAEMFEQLGIAYGAFVSARAQAKEVTKPLIAKATEELNKAYEEINSNSNATAAIAALLKSEYMPKSLFNSLNNTSGRNNAGRNKANENVRKTLDELESNGQTMVDRVAEKATAMNTLVKELNRTIAANKNANNDRVAWRHTDLTTGAVTNYTLAKKVKEQGRIEALKVRKAMEAVLRAEKEIINKRALAKEGKEIPTEEVLEGWIKAVKLADKALIAGKGTIVEFRKLTVAFNAIEAIKKAGDASKKVLKDKSYTVDAAGNGTVETHSYRFVGKSAQQKLDAEGNKINAANRAIEDWNSIQPSADPNAVVQQQTLFDNSVTRFFLGGLSGRDQQGNQNTTVPATNTTVPPAERTNLVDQRLTTL